jgi:hypothetical protein
MCQKKVLRYLVAVKKEGPAYEPAEVHDTIYPDGINT